MSIRKRTWVSGGKQKTAWLVDYRDGTGKRRAKSFDTKGAATIWASTTVVDVSKGTHVADSASKTVKQAAELWLTFCETGGVGDGEQPLERTTIAEYRRSVGYLTRPKTGIGGILLTQLTFERVRQFESDLMKTGKSRATARKVRTALSVLLSHAQDTGLVARHILRDRKRVARAPREAKEITIPDKTQLRALIDQSSGWFRPFVITAIFTGMRASELRGLPWTNVDLDAGLIRVRQRADKSSLSNRA